MRMPISIAFFIAVGLINAMKRSKALFTVVFAVTHIVAASPIQDYAKIHQDAIVVDLHCDTVWRLKEGIDLAKRDSAGQVDLPRLKEGGIDLQVFACYLGTSTPREKCRPTVDELIDTLESQVARHKDQIEICKTAAEAERIIGENKLAAFIGIENGVAIADSIENLRHFYDRGVRYMTLTHTSSNNWCISSADTAPAFHGLTDFGKGVVREMNRLGMIIDISHAHPTTVEEVLKITTDPVIASHSCVHALCPHDRNLTDEQIKAVAANGGVIGINFFTAYLSAEYNRRSDSLFGLHQHEMDSIRALYKDDPEARRKAIGPIYDSIWSQLATVQVSISTVIDHIDHIVKLVGPEYVALGSDFDGVPTLPVGLTDCTMMPNISKELVARGYSRESINKILGGNFMRVFRQVCDE